MLQLHKFLKLATAFGEHLFPNVFLYEPAKRWLGMLSATSGQQRALFWRNNIQQAETLQILGTSLLEVKTFGKNSLRAITINKKVSRLIGD